MSEYKIFDHVTTITVEPEDLRLDPNNPRFMDYKIDSVPEDKYLDENVIINTRNKMLETKNKFQIPVLVTNILTNGFRDYDSIFVEKYKDSGKYIVLEGNRRVTAIKEILNPENEEKYREKFSKYDEVFSSLDKIEVLELDNTLEKEPRDEMVRYILGIRHGKQIKGWHPFAIGRRVYHKYLETAQQTEETFEWDENAARKVAEEWTIIDKSKQKKEISTDLVRDSLITIRIMEQAMAVDAYNVEAKHWSLMLAGFARGAEDGVNKDIPYDHKTFLLDKSGLERLNQLCRFDKPRREGAAINNPQEWSKYSKIISDPELSEKDRNKYIGQVLKGKKPSEIFYHL